MARLIAEGEDNQQLSSEQLREVGIPTPVERALSTLEHPDSAAYTDFSIPVTAIFPNWDKTVQPILKEGTCLVVFQSERSQNADTLALEKADDIARVAAMFANGYLGYYRGNLVDGKCRSFCLWGSEESARTSASDPFHISASILSPQMFQHVQLDRFILQRTESNQLEFRLVQRRTFGKPAQPSSAPSSLRRA